MEELIKIFHIDYRLLLAQLINFVIVFLVLWFFALKPLMKIMHKRTETIEKSLLDAKKIEKNMLESEEKYKARLDKARREANHILETARLEGENTRKEMTTNAKGEIERLISGAKVQLQEEKKRMVQEAKREVVTLVTASLEKVLTKTLTPGLDETYIGKILDETKQTRF